MIVSGHSKGGINGKEESGNVPEARPSISPRSCRSLRIFAAAAALVSSPHLIHSSSSALMDTYLSTPYSSDSRKHRQPTLSISLPHPQAYTYTLPTEYGRLQASKQAPRQHIFLS